MASDESQSLKRVTAKNMLHFITRGFQFSSQLLCFFLNFNVFISDGLTTEFETKFMPTRNREQGNNSMELSATLSLVNP